MASGYELETKFFGFHPVEFIDNVINTVSDYVSDGADFLESSLVQLASQKLKGQQKRVKGEDAAAFAALQTQLHEVRRPSSEKFRPLICCRAWSVFRSCSKSRLIVILISTSCTSSRTSSP